MADRPRDNWNAIIECRDCGAHFRDDTPDYSTTLVNDKRTRLILLAVPNECPECRNLRVVEVKP